MAPKIVLVTPDSAPYLPTHEGIARIKLNDYVKLRFRQINRKTKEHFDEDIWVKVRRLGRKRKVWLGEIHHRATFLPIKEGKKIQFMWNHILEITYCWKEKTT